jgi:hypothetical protein
MSSAPLDERAIAGSVEVLTLQKEETGRAGTGFVILIFHTQGETFFDDGREDLRLG